MDGRPTLRTFSTFKGAFELLGVVATPPNAIVYGVGEVRREQMLRAGVLLGVVMILVTAGMVWVLLRVVWPNVVG